MILCLHEAEFFEHLRRCHLRNRAKFLFGLSIGTSISLTVFSILLFMIGVPEYIKYITISLYAIPIGISYAEASIHCYLNVNDTKFEILAIPEDKFMDIYGKMKQ